MDETINNQKKYQLNEYKKNIFLNMWIFVVFILTYGLYLSGELSLVKANKSALQQEMNSYKDIQKQWLSYEQILASIWNEEADLKKMFEESEKSNTQESVYKNIFWNTTDKNYLDFLSEKELNIWEYLQDESIQNRNQKLSIALPFYGEAVDSVIRRTWSWSSNELQDISEVRLTDVGYVNYIERLMRSFSLVTHSPISVGNAVLVDEKELENTQNSLASQMFYIPLTLDIEGRKADVVDFIHFIQHVGNISIVSKDEDFQDIEFHRDSVVQKRIIWDPVKPWYNIYENILTDIKSIQFEEFLDSSTTQRPSTGEQNALSFLQFIKGWPNANQAFKATIELKFFVRGLPIYKKDSYVLSVVEKFQTLSWKIALTTSRVNSQNILKTPEMVEVANSLKTLSMYVQNNTPKFHHFRQSFEKREISDTLFKQAYKAEQELDVIEALLEKNNTILDTISK